MGEITEALDKFIEDFEINDTTVDKTTIGEIRKMCKESISNECMMTPHYRCPFYIKNIGCAFKQGYTPNEW